jgi:hypothetical protein
MIPLLLSLTFTSLGAQSAGRQAPTPPAWPVEWIANHCPEFPVSFGVGKVVSCRVSESGQFASFRGDTYYYAFYCVESDSTREWGSCNNPDSEMRRLYSEANVAVFVRRGGAGAVRLVLSQYGFGGHFIGPPRIGESSQGAVMELPYSSASSCNCNGSSYYLWRPQSRDWVGLEDWGSWQKELAKKLPPDLGTWNDMWPDLDTLTTDGSLWRPDDAHCCPSGGTVHVQLGIVDNRFVLKSFRVDPP